MVYIATVVYCSDVYVCVWRHCRYFYRRASPAIVLYGGVAVLELFAECMNRCSDTFNANQNVFGKVYFPRLIVPLSIVVSSLVKMGIQFILFLLFICTVCLMVVRRM